MALEGAGPAGGGAMSQTMVVVVAIVVLVAGLGLGYGIGAVTLGEQQQAPDNLLEEIYQRDEMVVATDAAFPPFENVDPDTNEIVGFDIDLIRAIADIMGVEVEIRNVGFDAIFIAVPDRTVDIAISAITIRPDRAENMLFSDPYFESNLTAVINPGGPMEGEINDFDDLANKTIAVQEGTTSQFWVEDVLIGEMGVQPEELRTTTLFTDAIQLLLADEVDVVIIDEPVAEGYESAGEVDIVLRIPTGEEFGIAMPLGEHALKAVLDGALEQLRETGEYDRILDEWFSAPT